MPVVDALVAWRGMDNVQRAAQAPSAAHVIIAAARNGHKRMARVLLDMGVRADAVKPHDNGRYTGSSTALAAACARGSQSLVKMLLDSGADVNVPPVGRSPLVDAASAGRLPIVRLLLARGANPSARGPDGCTVLYRTVRDKGPSARKIARLLVKRGAEPYHDKGQARRRTPKEMRRPLRKAFSPAVSAATDAVLAFMEDRDAARLVMQCFSPYKPPPRPLGSKLLFGQFAVGGAPASPGRRRRSGGGGAAPALSSALLLTAGGPGWAVSVSAGHDRSSARLARCSALVAGAAAAAEQAKKAALIRSRVIVRAKRRGDHWS